jgi:hypothetical protein
MPELACAVRRSGGHQSVGKGPLRGQKHREATPGGDLLTVLRHDSLQKALEGIRADRAGPLEIEDVLGRLAKDAEDAEFERGSYQHSWSLFDRTLERRIGATGDVNYGVEPEEVPAGDDGWPAQPAPPPMAGTKLGC